MQQLDKKKSSSDKDSSNVKAGTVEPKQPQNANKEQPAAATATATASSSPAEPASPEPIGENTVLYQRTRPRCSKACTLGLLCPCFKPYQEIGEISEETDEARQKRILHTPGPNGDKLGPRPASRVFGDNQIIIVPWHIMMPESRKKAAWDWYVIILVLYNTFLIPFNFAFNPEPSMLLEIIDYFVDFNFAVDIYLSFNHAFEDRLGRAVLDTRRIASNYMKTWFVVDLFATLPIDLFVVGALRVLGKDTGGSNLQLFALLKAPRLLRIGRLMKKFDKLAAANALRIFKLMFFFLLVAHLVGCIWWFVGKSQESDVRWNYELECTDVPDPALCDVDTSQFRQYITSLYWALTTMTTVGYGDILPVSVGERGFTVIVFMLGAILYAGIFGNMALLIQRFDSKGEAYRVKVQGVNELLTFYNVTEALASRVRDSIDFYWKFSGGGLDFFQHLASLPRALQSDVALSLYEHVVSTAPIIKGCSRSFLREVAMRLRPQAALPNQYIFRAGDSGSEMFFVGKGQLAIMSSDGKTCFDVIGEGALVGERGLFFTGRRSAGLKTVTHSQLYGITKKDFQDVLSSFPEEYERMKNLAYQKRGADKKNREKAGKEGIGDNNGSDEDGAGDRKKGASGGGGGAEDASHAGRKERGGGGGEEADGVGKLQGAKVPNDDIAASTVRGGRTSLENRWARKLSNSRSSVGQASHMSSQLSAVSSMSKFDLDPPPGVSRIRRVMSRRKRGRAASASGRRRRARKSSFALVNPVPGSARRAGGRGRHMRGSSGVMLSNDSSRRSSSLSMSRKEPHKHPPGVSAADCRICNPVETGTIQKTAPRLTASALALAARGNTGAENKRHIGHDSSAEVLMPQPVGIVNLENDAHHESAAKHGGFGLLNSGEVEAAQAAQRRFPVDQDSDDNDFDFEELQERLFPMVAEAIAHGEKENRNWLIDQINDMRERQRAAFDTSSKRFARLERSASTHEIKLASIEKLLQDLAGGMRKLAEATTQAAKAQARQAQVQHRQQQIALLSGHGGLDASPYIVGNRGGNKSGNAFWLAHSTSGGGAAAAAPKSDAEATSARKNNVSSPVLLPGSVGLGSGNNAAGSD